MNKEIIKNGIWIRVKDLETAKRFYSELFSLPQAVFENPEYSVFPVEKNSFYLVLEKSTAPYLEHSCSANSFFITVESIEHAERVLEKYNISIFKNIFSFGNQSFHRTCDPEGNPLVFCIVAPSW